MSDDIFSHLDTMHEHVGQMDWPMAGTMHTHSIAQYKAISPDINSILPLLRHKLKLHNH